MNKKIIKEDLENILKLISNSTYEDSYKKLFIDFTSRMQIAGDVDEYLMYLSNKMLEFARKEDDRRELFLNSQRILRRLAHKIYRSYGDERIKNEFLTLVR